MKRYYAIFIILVLMLSICGCSQTNVNNNNADVTLTFIYGEENVEVTLEDDEAERLLIFWTETITPPFFPVFLPVVLIRTFLLKLEIVFSQLLVILVIAFKILVI